MTLNPAIDATLIIPEFSAGSVNRVERHHSKPGGKGVNVASALSDYGHRVAVTGFLGRENASLFEAFFSDKEIEDDFIRIKGETRTGIKIFDPAEGQTTDVNFPGLSPTPDDFESLSRKLLSLTSQSSPWLVLAGSLPPEVEPAVYRDLTLTFKSKGCRIMLDTSGEALRYALDAAPEIIKPNIHELEALAETKLTTDESIVSAARKVLTKGIELAVVSMGARGALFITGEQVISASPPEVQIGSSVGAGDAMVAGILAGKLRGLSLPEIARLSSAFSINAIASSQSKTPFYSNIETWIKKVTIREFTS